MGRNDLKIVDRELVAEAVDVARRVFARRLREARLASGLTQKEAAAGLGCCYATLSDYETGQAAPDVFRAALYGVTVDWLIWEEGVEE